MENDLLADTIAEDLLYLTGAALLSRDFQSFKSHFTLPLRLETMEGDRLVHTEAEFFEIFSAVVEHLESTDVEDLVRTVIYASFTDPDTIRSVHLCSEIHAGGELNRPAYPVHSTLVRNGNTWQISSCLYVILDNARHSRALVNVFPDKAFAEQTR